MVQDQFQDFETVRVTTRKYRTHLCASAAACCGCRCWAPSRSLLLVPQPLPLYPSTSQPLHTRARLHARTHQRSPPACLGFSWLARMIAGRYQVDDGHHGGGDGQGECEGGGEKWEGREETIVNDFPIQKRSGDDFPSAANTRLQGVWTARNCYRK